MQHKATSILILTLLACSPASDLHEPVDDRRLTSTEDYETPEESVVSSWTGPDYRRRALYTTTTTSKNVPQYLLDLEHGKNMTPEVFGQPYWEAGHWVFYRTTAATLPAKGYAVTLPVTASTIKGQRPNTGIAANRECNLDCLIIYAFYYGKVCGVRQNMLTWENTYKNFNDMCKLEYENCKDDYKRPVWRLAHRGDCIVLRKNFTRIYDKNRTLLMKRLANEQVVHLMVSDNAAHGHPHYQRSRGCDADL